METWHICGKTDNAVFVLFRALIGIKRLRHSDLPGRNIIFFAFPNKEKTKTKKMFWTRFCLSLLFLGAFCRPSSARPEKRATFDGEKVISVIPEDEKQLAAMQVRVRLRAVSRQNYHSEILYWLPSVFTGPRRCAPSKRINDPQSVRLWSWLGLGRSWKHENGLNETKHDM